MVYFTQTVALTPQRLIITGSILLCLCLAFWQSGDWYLQRVKFSLEEAVSALLVIVMITYLSVVTIVRSKTIYSLPLYTLSVLLGLYTLSSLYLPSLISAALALSTICFALFWLAFGRIPGISFWALVALSLPVVPSLQFYLGYPARLISASLTVPLLQLNGYQVQQQGTYLVWQDQLLQFDGPCSGVTMLWAGLLLTLLLSFWHQLSLKKIIIALIIGILAVLFGNVIRAASLFYLELGVLQEAVEIPLNSELIHNSVGVAAFIFVAVFIVYLTHRLSLWVPRKHGASL